MTTLSVLAAAATNQGILILIFICNYVYISILIVEVQNILVIGIERSIVEAQNILVIGIERSLIVVNIQRILLVEIQGDSAEVECVFLVQIQEIAVTRLRRREVLHVVQRQNWHVIIFVE